MHSLAVSSLVVLACLTVPASADVLVVDQAGGGDFTLLEQAIAAAADGDTLLVRPGFYGNAGLGNIIAGRSLVIAADGAGEVRTGAVFISAPGERVVLRGLTLDPNSQEGNSACVVSGGDVFIDGCTILGRDGNYFAGIDAVVGGTGISVGTGNVVLKDCVVKGGRGSDNQIVVALNAQRGGPGLTVGTTATVAIHGGSISGGAGGDDTDGFSHGASGAHGVWSFGTLLVAGCTITGGDGGSSANPGGLGLDFYAAGDGVHANAGSVSLRDVVLIGGAPGQNGSGEFGEAGVGLQSEDGVTVVEFPDAYRSLGLGAPAPEGGVLTLAYAGEAGDLVGLYLAVAPAVLPGPQGLFHLSAPLIGPLVLGTAGPAGTLALDFGVPNLGFGPEDSLTLYGQALVKPSSGAVLLSSPTTAVLIDDSL